MLIEAIERGNAIADGRYRITRLLGEGGMGLVYLAHDCRLGVDVVIKIPRPALLQDPGFAGRFSREIRALVQLSHPHIVKVNDVGEHEGVPFAVLQFLRGGSLRDRQVRVKGGQPLPLPAQHMHGWLSSVAAALDFIHGSGFIHRDVKPENILFDEHGNAFLADFGVAKVLADDRRQEKRTVYTQTGMALGTSYYMAPEMLLGRAYDGRADQYALAVTLFELLTGGYPFEGDTPAAIALQQAQGLGPAFEHLPVFVSQALAEAVRKGLALEPHERYSDCRGLADAVLATVVDSPATMPTGETRVSGDIALPQTAFRCSCPNCRKQFNLKAEFMGRRVRCPVCEMSFLAPECPPALLAAATESVQAHQANVDTIHSSGTVYLDPKHVEEFSASRGVTGEGGATSPPLLHSRKKRWLLAGTIILTGLILAGVLSWVVVPSQNRQAPHEEIASSPPPIAPASERPSFEINTRVRELRVWPGQQAKTQVYLTRKGYNGSVAFRVEGLGKELQADIVPAKAGALSTELVVSAALRGQVLRHDVRIVAVASEKNGTSVIPHADFPLTVMIQGIPDLSVRVSAAMASLRAQEKQLVDITVDRYWCSGPVAMQVTELPSHISCAGTVIPEGQNSGRIEIAAGADIDDAQVLANVTATLGRLRTAVPLKIVTRAEYQLRQFVGHEGPIRCVHFLPDQQQAVTGSNDKTVRLWDIESGNEVWKNTHTAAIDCITLAPRGDAILTGSADGTVRQIETNGGKTTRVFTGQQGPLLVLVAQANQVSAVNQNGVEKTWDLNSPQGKRSSPRTRIVAGAIPFYQSISGHAAILGRGNNVLTVSDRITGPLFDLKGHTGAVRSVSVGLDETQALSAAADGTIHWWNLKTGKSLHRFTELPTEVLSVALAEGSREFLLGGKDGILRLWRLPGK